MLALIHAHPHPRRSRANRVLLEAVRDLAGIEVRSLYDLYPDFSLDVEAERSVLARAKLVVWQHPMYWYGVPPLLKLYFDEVMTSGWAYGEGGDALRGKSCLWVVTTGGGPEAFSPEGAHGHSFSAFVPAMEQTARFCGMTFLPPLVVHGARKIEDDDLEAWARRYRELLIGLAREHGDG